ncbi:MAG: hypothetical protein WCF18_03980 [Chthoniobacteraceae bacterium]
MNHSFRSAITMLVLASFALTTAAQADDKAKKMWQYQQQQQQAAQQWKLEQTQRNQQQQQQQDLQRRRAVAAAGTPWGVNQKGRGHFTFNTQLPDKLNFASVTLNNFYSINGNVNGSGSAVVTLNGSYGYAMRGTWTLQGNLTVGLSLTPASNAARGDRISGNLTMRPPNGTSISSITLTGVMGGNPFTASFAGQ